MDATKRLTLKLFGHTLGDRLFRNSLWLMLSTAVMGLSGFVFWGLETHHYSPESVGIVSTLIAAITLMSTLCLLGLNISIINEVPKVRNASSLINSASLIVFLATVLCAFAFCLISGAISPHLEFLRHDSGFIILFVLFTVLTTLDTLFEGVFIAYRDTFIILVKNSLISIGKVCLALLAFSGLQSLFVAYYISLLISPALSYTYLKKKFAYNITAKAKVASYKQVMSTSLGNYAESVASVLPPSILPLILITRLGAAATAYYYIAMTIANAIYAIPKAVARNLIVDLSVPTVSTKKHVLHACKTLTIILTPVLAIVYLFGHQLLGIFGNDYAANGYTLLVMLASASILISANSVYWAILNARGESTTLVWINLSSMVIILLLSYAFLRWGLPGVGLAWIAGQFIQLVFYVISSSSIYRKMLVSPEV